MSLRRDEAEIVRLYDDTAPELHRLLLRRLGNRQEAEEVAQDAFEKLCLISQREDIADLRKYFFTMANRMALNALRRRLVEKASLASGQHLVLVDYPDNDPEAIASSGEQLELVRRALMELPEKTRQIFLLHRFEGYTYQEIARHVGLSTKAVEYHMKNALSAVLSAAKET